MVDELSHRVKNTLVTVQSIAAHTLRGADPMVYQVLEGRLQALAAVHDVLTGESWKDAGLIEVIEMHARALRRRRRGATRHRRAADPAFSRGSR